MHLLTDEEGELALKAARAFVEAAVNRTKPAQIMFPQTFSKKRGVFVTLTEFGELRGCIGFPRPVMPLYDAIFEAAKSAALHDPRFYPVGSDELENISLEVTVLTEPTTLDALPASRPNAVEIGRHGLIASCAGRSGLLLPQVAEEYGWNAEEFLCETCIKAGLAANAWQDSKCVIQTFEGQIFNESRVFNENQISKGMQNENIDTRDISWQ